MAQKLGTVFKKNTHTKVIQNNMHMKINKQIQSEFELFLGFHKFLGALKNPRNFCISF